MKHYRIITLTALLAICLLVIGCGSGAATTPAAQATTPPQATTASQPTSAPPSTSSGQATATTQPQATTSTSGSTGGAVALQLFGWSSSTAEDALLNQILTNFNGMNHGYTASFNPAPNYDQSLQTALAGGSPPDVFYIDSLKFPDFIKNNVLATPPAGAIQNPDDFYPSERAAFTANGTFYCPPKDFSTLGLFYNKQMLDAAGVQVPTNWDELKAAATKLTDKSKGVYGLSLSADAARWLAFLYQAGGHVINDNGKMDINTPEAKTALDYYTGLLTDGVATTPDKVSAGWNGEAFEKGKVAMTVEGNWLVADLQKNFPNVQYGVAELPAGPAGKATLSFTVCYAVPKTAKNPDASWKLVSDLTSPEGMQQWTDLGLAMPTRKSLASHWLQKFPNLKPFLNGADYAHAWQFGPGFTTVTDAINAGIQKIAAGQSTSDAVLQDVQQTGQQILGGS